MNDMQPGHDNHSTRKAEVFVQFKSNCTFSNQQRN